MKYRPEVDGLRAVAVLPVVLFHAGFEAFRGGFVGVDVFFVVSGYLITGIIYTEVQKGSFSIVQFYERRVRRILPALFVVCLACVPFAWLWMLPHELRDFSQSLIAVNLFSSNILFWKESGYFAAATELKPLLHTWSLAGEEQFYLVFPLFLLVFRRLSRNAMLGLLLCLSLLSLGLAEWGSRNYPAANFYFLPPRAWELGVGAILAIGSQSWKQPKGLLPQLASMLGLGMVTYAVFAFDDTVPFPSRWALIPVLGTALVIAYGRPETAIGKALSWKPVVGVGLISYSAYLWHQPLFAFARLRTLDEVSTAQYLVLGALAFVLAYLSWRFIERPFRAKGGFSRFQIFSGAGLVASGLIALGLIGHLDRGHASRFDQQTSDILAFREADSTACHNMYDDPSEILAGEICEIGKPGAGPSIAILGDSHAAQLTDAISEDLESLGLGAVIYSGSWCAPLYGFGTSNPKKNPACRGIITAAYDQTIRDHNIDTVILFAQWANYTKGDRWKGVGAAAYDDGTIQNDSIENNAKFFESALHRTLDLLESAGKNVIIVKSVPEYAVSIPLALARANWLDIEWSEVAGLARTMEDYRERNVEVERVFAKLASRGNLSFVDPVEWFCDDRVCRPFDSDGMPWYQDTNHMSYRGAKILSEATLSTLRASSKL